MRSDRLLLPTLLAALAVAAPALGQDRLPPSLTVDTAFAPPTGIARDGGTGTGTDIPGGVAVDGERIYVTGESNGVVAVIARAANGTYDSAFGDGDGRVDVDLGTGKDVGSGILVLPDGRLRILAATDADTSSSTNMDVAVIGLNPDGSPDTAFGGGDGQVSFPIGVIDDAPSRFVADAAGRLAITGWRKDTNGKEDTFVAILNADGTPDAAFDEDGIKTYDRAGNAINDRGIDIAWRGTGVIVLQQVATVADTNVNNYVSVLHALDATGADDPSFSDDGDMTLEVGEPNTIPGALLDHNGRYWVTGSTKVGADTDAFLFRSAHSGADATFRRFDMRGPQIDPNTSVVSGGGDLAVFDDGSPTLVVVGSTTYNSRTFWSAAAFNEFEGDLAAAGFGDQLIPTDEYGALLGVAAGKNWLATTGSLLNVNGNFDTSFGTLRLLVDADKQCDLALGIPQPLEATLEPGSATGVTVKVVNSGTRACRGEVTVASPFGLRRAGAFGPLSTDLLRPSREFVSDGVELTYDGPLQREGHAIFRVTAAGDAQPQNDEVRLHVLFSYCDAELSLVGTSGFVPTEGLRRFDFEVRSRGTVACSRARVVAGGGVKPAASSDATVASGRSISQELYAAPDKPGKPGEKVSMTFKVQTDRDVSGANDEAKFDGTFLGVGDSDVSRAGSRGIAGRARGGRGPATSRQRRVSGVHVAIQRLGKGCRWLASSRGGWRTRKARGKSCPNPVWLRATGTRSWRLALKRRLPRGRYVVLSRARIGAGLVEARFTAKDRNRRVFRVG